VLILFAKMNDGGLRLCVDYLALSKATVKNLSPLPLISEMLDREGEVRLFTKLDLRGAYNLFRFKQGDEDKTAFRKCCGQFKYRVMPFGLTDALATFQSYIDDCQQPYIDHFAVWYLDNILIDPTTEKDHKEHVWPVPQRRK
jgi:hypothetical protein